MQLGGIPAVGYTFPILNWITGIQYLFQARKLIQEGYEKARNLYFPQSYSTERLILH